MWTWLVVPAVLVVFFLWVAWVRRGRNPAGPGDPDHRQDHNYYGGPPGSGSAG